KRRRDANKTEAPPEDSKPNKELTMSDKERQEKLNPKGALYSWDRYKFMTEILNNTHKYSTQNAVFFAYQLTSFLHYSTVSPQEHFGTLWQFFVIIICDKNPKRMMMRCPEAWEILFRVVKMFYNCVPETEKRDV
ncbi:hypothetical protein PFISCL1PPCAC_992, partial [Pristionchus fissidentatus]